jgi:hypothetical protein
MRSGLRVSLVVAVVAGPLCAVAGTTVAAPGDEVVAGEPRVDVTFQSAGVYWPVSSDNNRNASLTLDYRPAGTSTWLRGAPAMRATPTTVVDGAPLGLNHLAASALLLQPGAAYEVRATIADPDGGGAQRTFNVITRTEPVASALSTTRYVVPGSGGGAGTQADPYRGLQAAANAAQPGDLFQVAAGTYAPFSITRSGTAGAPIVFRGSSGAVVDGGNTSRGVVTIGSIGAGGQHIIVEGLTIQNGAWGVDADSTSNITIRGNTIRNVSFGIYNRRDAAVELNQTIVDNVISGRTPWPGAGIPPERGIDLRGHGNVVANNSVDHFGDCISVQPSTGPSYGNDIVGNDASYCVDDGIEIDYNIANVRVWRNRVTNARMGVSVQPIKGGPAYIFRNELLNLENNPIKLNNQPSGLVVVHNTSVKLGNALSDSIVWRNAIFRNNAMFGTEYAFEFFTSADEGFRDFDYNAWGSGRAGTTASPRFKWNNVRYPTIADLRTVGVETHGKEVTATALTNAVLGATWEADIPPGSRDLRPSTGSPLINGGIPYGNFDVGFITDGAPDMGAFEAGEAAVTYGPRGATPPPAVVSGRFVPFGPKRQLDTREGAQGGRHPGGLATRTYTLPDLPASAVGATFTLAAVGPAENGFLGAFPCGGPVPTTASLTYQSDRYVTSNQATVKASGSQVCVVSSQPADVTIDLVGWWVTDIGSEFTAQQDRLWDTRERGGPTTALRVDLGVAAQGASGVTVTLAAVAGNGGYLTAYDCAIEAPLAASLNTSPGLTVASMTTVALRPGSRELCLLSSSPRNIVVDLIGTWGSGTGVVRFSPLSSPARPVDTRTSGGRLVGGATTQVMPPAAGTIYANATAVGSASAGFISLFPCSIAWPGTSTVNMRANVAASNAAWIDARSGICAYASTATQLVVDVFGIAAPA